MQSKHADLGAFLDACSIYEDTPVPVDRRLARAAGLGMGVTMAAALIFHVFPSPADVAAFPSGFFLLLGDQFWQIATWIYSIAPLVAAADGVTIVAVALLLVVTRGVMRREGHIALFASLFVPLINIVLLAPCFLIALLDLAIWTILIAIALCIVLGLLAS